MPRSASCTSAYLPTVGERPWQLQARSSWQPRLGRAWCSLPRARRRTRHCRRRDTASSADVAGQSRLSPRRSSFRGWLLTEPVSDRHQRVTTAVAAALDRTEAASRWMRHDPPCGRCVAGVWTCSGALLYARVSFPSPHEGGLLCGLLDFRHVFSSVLSDRREPPGL